MWCYRWCTNPEHLISLAEFATQLGASKNTIYKVFAGKYYAPDNKTLRIPPPKILSRMREFKSLEEHRWKMGTVTFCMTETAKTVFRACNHARQSKTPVFLSGASHIGKTWALREYYARNKDNLTYYVRLRSASGVLGVVKLIAEQLGVTGQFSKDRLVNEIIKRLTPNSVLILDECHLLMNTYRKESMFSCFETLRDIFDLAQCGVVLSFTNLGRDKVERERSGELNQLLRRSIHRFNLGDQPTRADLKKLAQNWGMEYPKRSDEAECRIDGSIHRPFEIIKNLTRDYGLKSFTERLRYARTLSRQKEETTSWNHFLEAHFMIQDNAIAPQAWN